MNHIKYRVWDTVKQKMCVMGYGEGEYQAHINPQGELTIFEGRELPDVGVRFVSREADEFVIMQTTGLKDCKGCEMFDRDLINRIQPFSGSPKVVEIPDCYDPESDGSVYVSSNWEIVGNVFTHPELLKL